MSSMKASAVLFEKGSKRAFWWTCVDTIVSMKTERNGNDGVNYGEGVGGEVAGPGELDLSADPAGAEGDSSCEGRQVCPL